jgi:hypothetical protein
MKSSADRIAKYTDKYDVTVLTARLTTAKQMAIDKITAKFPDLVAMELAVQTVLNQDGIVTSDRPKFYNFGREIWKKVQDGVADPALTTWATEECYPKYVAKGCASATLINVALDVFSITIPSP